MIATEAGHESCSATLYFKNSVETLQTCKTEQLIFPSTKKAENLRYGVWLITSTITAYILYESDNESTTSYGTIISPGCRICITALKCGRQMSGSHTKIRSDLSTCEQLPAIEIRVKFPDPLKQLWSELPAIDDMPFHSTKAEAGVVSLKERLLESPKMRDLKRLLDIANPFTS